MYTNIYIPIYTYFDEVITEFVELNARKIKF